MKLTRRGARRNYGTDVLLDEDMTKRKTDRWNAPKWDAETRSLTFQCRGGDRGSNYKYSVTIAATELVSFLDLAVPALAADAASRAVCFGAIAALQELLTARAYEP